MESLSQLKLQKRALLFSAALNSVALKSLQALLQQIC